MKASLTRNSRTSGFTLIELLVVVNILGILMYFALPSYITSVYSGRMGVANSNARILATLVQAKALIMNSYDTTLSDYTVDMGGAMPLNPCTGTNTGYSITATSTTATVQATTGSNCGTWTPIRYAVVL